MTFNMNVHQPDESVYELLDLTKKNPKIVLSLMKKIL